MDVDLTMRFIVQPFYSNMSCFVIVLILCPYTTLFRSSPQGYPKTAGYVRAPRPDDPPQRGARYSPAAPCCPQYPACHTATTDLRAPNQHAHPPHDVWSPDWPAPDQTCGYGSMSATKRFSLCWYGPRQKYANSNQRLQSRYSLLILICPMQSI